MTTAASLVFVLCSGIMVRRATAIPGIEASDVQVMAEDVREASTLMDQRRFERSLAPSATSLFRRNFVAESVEKSGKIVIPDAMPQFLTFLASKSPPHQLYLLFDSNYKGLDSVLQFYSKSWTECTVIEYTPDLKYFVDVVSTPLTGTNTGRRHILVLCSRENVAEDFQASKYGRRGLQ
ncbi:uncharacterized protein [Macrobrachium rosenbergii]|uniref:uncharacterized protein n=1 Tax=Macrobrachium rosenbergii TaxID=79674 RepID=UPI0034D54DB6